LEGKSEGGFDDELDANGNEGKEDAVPTRGKGDENEAGKGAAGD
jgi:hypothetical protein